MEIISLRNSEKMETIVLWQAGTMGIIVWWNIRAMEIE